MNSNRSSKPRPKTQAKGKNASHHPKKKGNSGKRWYLGINNLAMGSGDAPKQRSRSAINMAPSTQSSNTFTQGVQTITQDELVGTVSMTESFRCVSYAVQPGLAENYPWLSQVASLYQKYAIEEMVYYYKPLVSQYAPLGQQGRIVLSFDTDAAATPLTSLQQAEGMSPHADGIPFERINLALPRRANLQLYVRNAALPYGADIKTYDAGKLFVSTQGGKSEEMSGELRVSYRIRLMLPVIAGVTQVSEIESHRFSRLALQDDVQDLILTSGTLVPVKGMYFTENGLGVTTAVEDNYQVVTVPAGSYVISWTANKTGQGCENFSVIGERDNSSYSIKALPYAKQKEAPLPTWATWAGSTDLLAIAAPDSLVNCSLRCRWAVTSKEPIRLRFGVRAGRASFPECGSCNYVEVLVEPL